MFNPRQMLSMYYGNQVNTSNEANFEMLLAASAIN